MKRINAKTQIKLLQQQNQETNMLIYCDKYLTR